jgi:transcription-repair coupling factor (superfamily II helicase)
MFLPPVAELTGRVTRHPEVEACLDALKRGAAVTRLGGVSDPAKALITAHVAASLHRPVFLLVESNERAEMLLEPVRFFFRAMGGKPAAVALLPAFDVLPWQDSSPHPQILETRAVSLWRLGAGQVQLVIVPLGAALGRYRDRDFYAGLARALARDQDAPLEEFLAHLASVGYERREMVEMPGQFAVRGGIVDVFSPEAARPVRLELFGDAVESLREFDVETQRSVGPLERVVLAPLSEFKRQEVNEVNEIDEIEDRTNATLMPGWEFDALRWRDATGTLFALCDAPGLLVDEPEALEEEKAKFRAVLEECGAESATYFLSSEEWAREASGAPRLLMEHLAMTRAVAGETPEHVLATQPTTRFHGSVPAFMAEVRKRMAAGEHMMAASGTTGELERLADLCHEYEVPYRLGELQESTTTARLTEDATSDNGSAMVLVRAPISEGVAFPESAVVVYGTGDLFPSVAGVARPKQRAKTAGFFSDFSELKPGDFVVHVDHGIGQFEGLRQLESGHARGEFMLLRYAEDARLYVPLERLDLVQSYRSMGGGAAQLDKLGGTSWGARKARVRKSLASMADQLLGLYAERKTVEGFAFSADSEWQREFEDAFDFEETRDQAAAIVDVKSDMERSTPMDRLLCGDVGYGKTEVAMRAAFKAVGDSKQVAVLAPTTVLAFQHFETFKRRLAAFPIRIEMLSRFRTTAEQKVVMAGLEAGQVDIVIGTHRVLSKDVQFSDLGLLVVDEEQRFGVAHKERLKEMRKNVDVLTLSATPIPRTLHMSLAGLRDMSVIESPPKDRLAIQTVVSPFNEAMVRRAIEEELAREGQVFFVHNRVESIYSLANLVKRLVPLARVVVGHGQMNEKELESVMLKFVRNEADVLVATTIIENGLDIPRANTILINRADRFGLSELYQLRGRVGRSDQRAYAYLLVPPEGSLTPIARRRLAALKEFSDLGSGFRIAALDLELRGAGNLLGREQHGHIEAIGFDLFVQMLERAVAERKGEVTRPELRTTINLGTDIRISPEYIPSENLRLRTYKRIAGILGPEQREEVEKELADRFGPPPRAVGHLLDYALLKAVAEKILVATVERQGRRVAVKFHSQTPVKPELVVKLAKRRRGTKFDPSGVLWIELETGQGSAAQEIRNVLLELQGQA